MHRETPMNFLIYGAGVIGTLYAAKLRDAGNQVTVLARGKRLTDIRRYGLALENVVSGDLSTTQVDTIERLAPDDHYDVALVTVRRDQLAGVLPELKANRVIPTFLFMLNNPAGSTGLVQTLGRDRVLLGFPGAGGTPDGHVMRYALIAQQPTMLGELNGRPTARLQKLAEIFRASGFATRISNDMDAWLKAHAFFVTAICGAIYIAGGNCHNLSENKAALALMASGVHEGFAAVRALGLVVRPFALRVLFVWLPQWFAIAYWRRYFASRMADHVFGSHARSASNEMREIAEDCRILLDMSGVEARALPRLYHAIGVYADRAGSIP